MELRVTDLERIKELYPEDGWLASELDAHLKEDAEQEAALRDEVDRLREALEKIDGVISTNAVERLVVIRRIARNALKETIEGAGSPGL